MKILTKTDRLLNERLKKVSETVYQQANPPPDQNRPLEWRRSFHFVTFPLKRIESICSFHVQSHRFDPERKDHSWKSIEPEVSTSPFITAVVDVDDEQCTDFVFCAVTDKETGLTKIEKPENGTKVTLRAGGATVGNEDVPAGIYPGHCFRSNWPPDGDRLCFELQLPEAQIMDLLQRLNRDPKTKVTAGIHLLSFGYEVDDMFRDPWDKQYLFVEDNAPAPVAFVKLSSSVAVEPDSAHEPTGEPKFAPPNEASEIAKTIRNLIVAIWSLVGLAAYWLFMR